MKILQSASRVVFVLLTVALIALTWHGLVDPKDFVVLTGMAFTYYFTKSSPQKPVEG